MTRFHPIAVSLYAGAHADRGAACGVTLPGGIAAPGALRCSPAHALLSPGSRMAQAGARPPADLPDERLLELLEHAYRWVQWAETESTRRAELQAEAARGTAQLAQPPWVPRRAALAPAALAPRSRPTRRAGGGSSHGTPPAGPLPWDPSRGTPLQARLEEELRPSLPPPSPSPPPPPSLPSFSPSFSTPSPSPPSPLAATILVFVGLAAALVTYSLCEAAVRHL